MNELVARLAQGDHPVTVGGPEPTLAEFRRRLETLHYVFIKFTDTKGGTDLGITLDQSATDLRAADLETGTGMVHVEGTLSLNFVPVRCVADIDLGSLTGTGHLVPSGELATPQA